MITTETPLVLGSASPRRSEILRGLGIPIRVRPADVEESVRPAESPLRYVERAVASLARSEPCAGVLVADTIVVVDGEVLGKPADVADAERLLGKLVGRAHTVYTRYAISKFSELGIPAVTRTVESRVVMRAASAGEIARYAATGEGLDKAGAYAIQGIGAFLVERIDGSYSNVVGLPACEVVVDLVRVGLLREFPV
jgi:septum formation protein